VESLRNEGAAQSSGEVVEDPDAKQDVTAIMDAAAKQPDTKVDEPMPDMVEAAAAPDAEQEQDATSREDGGPRDEPQAKPEAKPEAKPKPRPRAKTRAASASKEPEPAREPKPKPETAGPTLVRSGSFVGADASHRGSGKAQIFRGPDGKQILRLRGFRVTNGPDLRVLLTKDPRPGSKAQVQRGKLDLGALKANTGNQNYTIGSRDVSDYDAAIIYCRRFGVVFATATLR
jgi:hypothetical protein